MTWGRFFPSGGLFPFPLNAPTTVLLTCYPSLRCPLVNFISSPDESTRPWMTMTMGLWPKGRLCHPLHRWRPDSSLSGRKMVPAIPASIILASKILQSGISTLSRCLMPPLPHLKEQRSSPSWSFAMPITLLESAMENRFKTVTC